MRSVLAKMEERVGSRWEIPGRQMVTSPTLDPQSRLALDQGVGFLVEEAAARKLQPVDAGDCPEERQRVRRAADRVQRTSVVSIS